MNQSELDLIIAACTLKCKKFLWTSYNDDQNCKILAFYYSVTVIYDYLGNPPQLHILHSVIQAIQTVVHKFSTASCFCQSQIFKCCTRNVIWSFGNYMQIFVLSQATFRRQISKNSPKFICKHGVFFDKTVSNPINNRRLKPPIYFQKCFHSYFYFWLN